MPIPKHLRKFYRGPWRLLGKLIRARAGGQFTKRGRYIGGAKCERCQAPDGLAVIRYNHGRPGWWFDVHSGESHDQDGVTHGRVHCSDMPGDYETVRIVLTVAHLNHTPGDDRWENLALLCQWHHNHHDGRVRALHAKETRLTNKDAGRPLLQEASA